MSSASVIRGVFAAAVLASIAIAAIPAAATAAEPLVSVQWLKDHQSDPAIVGLDVRSAIDGGGGEAYAKAHIPGAVQSGCDKAGRAGAVVGEGEGAMAPGRKTVGATNPADAEPGTTRGDLAMSMPDNLVHGSDAPESAEREIALWFSADELA